LTANVANVKAMSGSAVYQPWRARLELGFEAQENRTVLKHRLHHGPLRVQKALWPEPTGVCHVILIHPPAGIAGGDELTIQVAVQPNAHALLTTPGAGKWYGSDGRLARQSIQLTVGDEARLEWLPQEIMLYDGARATSQFQVDLSESSSLIAWDFLVIGRQSRGERFHTGQYHNQVQIRQNGQLLLDDRLQLQGGDRWLTSPLGMAGHSLVGTLWALPPLAQRDEQILDAQIDSLRDLIVRMKMPLVITRLDHLLVARYLGDDPRQAMDGFSGIRARLRRLWWGLDEELPRIWRT